jgi:hypothetical protein
MKIIQIISVGEGKSAIILGLGDDGGIYEWHFKTATWSLWGVLPVYHSGNFHPNSDEKTTN